jgi:hypothetical protein
LLVIFERCCKEADSPLPLSLAPSPTFVSPLSPPSYDWGHDE